MSFEYRHAFVFTGVSEDAREIIVNTFSEFDWEEGLDVNTETVCVLDYGSVDRETAKVISEWSSEEAEEKTKKNFDMHLEEWEDYPLFSKACKKQLKELSEMECFKGLFGAPQYNNADIIEVMDNLKDKKHKIDEFFAAIIILFESNKKISGKEHAFEVSGTMENALLAGGNFFTSLYAAIEESNNKGGIFSKEIDNRIITTYFVDDAKKIWVHQIGNADAMGGNYNFCENFEDDEIQLSGSSKGF